MSSATLTRNESITSDPVVINNPSSTDVDPSNPATVEERLRILEAQILPTSRSQSPVREREFRERESREIPMRVVNRRQRSYSPIPIRETTILSSSTALLNHLTTSTTPDSLVEVQSGVGRHNSQIVHLTTLPIHQLELNNISWVFQTAIDEIWVQKPVGGVKFDVAGASRRGRGVEYFDDRYAGYEREAERYERSITPIVKLGTIFTAFKDEKELVDAEVKYVTIIQTRAGAGWVKLLTSYSRQAALVDIFHELLNGFSVLFVGAVLVDVDFAENWRPGCVYKKVGSVAEAKALKDVIGVIC